MTGSKSSQLLLDFKKLLFLTMSDGLEIPLNLRLFLNLKVKNTFNRDLLVRYKKLIHINYICLNMMTSIKFSQMNPFKFKEHKKSSLKFGHVGVIFFWWLNTI